MRLTDIINSDNKISGPYSGMTAGGTTFPDIYTLTDARHDMSILDLPDSESTLVLGVDGHGEPITVDLNAESPHILMSAGTGGGKSATMRALAMQALAKGHIVIILDIKRHSHMWAERLPNVLYARDLREIGNALIAAGEECRLRNHEAECWLRAQNEIGNWDVSITDAPMIKQRFVILYEEMNSTHNDLEKATRRRFRNSDEYTALDGFRDVVNMGRAAKMHMLCVGQGMDAKTMGGTAIRNNFADRILVHHNKDVWSMLAYDCGLPLAAPEERGRGYICRNGKARKIQLLYVTEREAHEFVLNALPKALTAAPTASHPRPGLPA